VNRPNAPAYHYLRDVNAQPPAPPAGVTVTYLDDDKAALYQWHADPRRLLYGVLIEDARGNPVAQLMSGGWQYFEHVGDKPKDVCEIIEDPKTRKIVRRFFYVNAFGLRSSRFTEVVLSLPISTEGVKA
jgi:hypothetical protein